MAIQCYIKVVNIYSEIWSVLVKMSALSHSWFAMFFKSTLLLWEKGDVTSYDPWKPVSDNYRVYWLVFNGNGNIECL